MSIPLTRYAFCYLCSYDLQLFQQMEVIFYQIYEFISFFILKRFTKVRCQTSLSFLYFSKDQTLNFSYLLKLTKFTDFIYHDAFFIYQYLTENVACNVLTSFKVFFIGHSFYFCMIITSKLLDYFLILYFWVSLYYLLLSIFIIIYPFIFLNGIWLIWSKAPHP